MCIRDRDPPVHATESVEPGREARRALHLPPLSIGKRAPVGYVFDRDLLDAVGTAGVNRRGIGADRIGRGPLAVDQRRAFRLPAAQRLALDKLPAEAVRLDFDDGL